MNNKKQQVNLKLLKSYPNQEKVFSKYSIYFMHIPKCGGTTIDQIFKKLSLTLNVFDFKRFSYRILGQKKKFLLLEKNLEFPCYISGHLDCNFADKISKLFKCTIFRVLSSYSESGSLGREIE